VKIVVEPFGNRRYKAVLFINNEPTYEAVDLRPGCAIRSALNQLQSEFGKPDGEIIVHIEGW
jgi:hypothetical protein